MVQYPITWKEYCIGPDQKYTIALCGYSGKVRQLSTEAEPSQKMFLKHVSVGEGRCSSEDHCLAFDCQFNHTNQHHLPHMFDMWTDQPADVEMARAWGKDTVVGCLVEIAHKISEEISKT